MSIGKASIEMYLKASQSGSCAIKIPVDQGAMRVEKTAGRY